MTITASARVPTQNASRFLQQLCKHWGHKFEVAFDAEQGSVRFPVAQLSMAAEPEALVVTLTSDTPETATRMQEVVATHLDRFAFREAPLAFDWQRADPTPG